MTRTNYCKKHSHFYTNVSPCPECFNEETGFNKEMLETFKQIPDELKAAFAPKNFCQRHNRYYSDNMERCVICEQRKNLPVYKILFRPLSNSIIYDAGLKRKWYQLDLESNICTEVFNGIISMKDLNTGQLVTIYPTGG